jgi:tetratricopeptide (TPR) repeat protein
VLDAYYAPLADPSLGRLYEPSADLLAAGRDLPKAVDLGVVLQGGEATAAQPEAQPAQPPAAPVELPKWLAVLDHAVVGDEELAHAHFVAGSFPEAAALYRKLRQQSPDDAHLLVMLLLSERNAGNADEARKLLAEVQQRGGEAAKWAEWLGEMMKLNETPTKEAK